MTNSTKTTKRSNATTKTARAAKARKRDGAHRTGLADAIAPLLGLEKTRADSKGAPEGYARGYAEGLLVAFALQAREEGAHLTPAYAQYAGEQRALHIGEGLIEPGGMTADERAAIEELAKAAGCSATEYQGRRRAATAEARGWPVLRGASAAAAS